MAPSGTAGGGCQNQPGLSLRQALLISWHRDIDGLQALVQPGPAVQAAIVGICAWVIFCAAVMICHFVPLLSGSSGGLFSCSPLVAQKPPAMPVRGGWGDTARTARLYAVDAFLLSASGGGPARQAGTSRSRYSLEALGLAGGVHLFWRTAHLIASAIELSDGRCRFWLCTNLLPLCSAAG